LVSWKEKHNEITIYWEKEKHLLEIENKSRNPCLTRESIITTSPPSSLSKACGQHHSTMKKGVLLKNDAGNTTLGDIPKRL
jgi:hypothetical protein